MKIPLITLLTICALPAFAANWTNFPAVAVPASSATFLVGTATTNQQVSAEDILNWTATNAVAAAQSEFVRRALFVATTNTTHTGTGAGSAFSSGAGSLTIPADSVVSGGTYRLSAFFKADVQETGDLNIKVFLNSTELTGALVTFNATSVTSFNVEFLITFRSTGASASVVAGCSVVSQSSVDIVFLGNLIVAGTANTTAPITFDVRNEWDGPEANSITCSAGLLEKLF